MNRKHARTKRVLGMVLALVLILSQSIFTIPVQAATVPTDTVFTVGSDSAMAGESFSIPISVKDCANFYALGLEILYDETVFELTGIALHDDRNPLTGYEMDLPDNISEGTLNIVKTGTGNMAFEDGPILLLTFKVLEDAMTNPYEIGLKVSDADWANWEEELLEGTFIAGAIQVTGIDGEAEYAGYQYPTLIEAMEAAAGSGSPALVKVLKHIQIDHEDDHLIIPFGADITLDMNGKTIMADYAGGHLIEVESGGKLTLTSTAGARGKFVYAERPDYSDWEPGGLSFLINEGTLNMSRVDVEDFWQGLVDGKFVDAAEAWGVGNGAGGTFDLIEDCDFDTVFTAIGLGGSEVGTIKNCLILADAFPVAFGLGLEGEDYAGTVQTLDNTTIFSGHYDSSDLDTFWFGNLYVGPGWTVEEIRDTEFVARSDDPATHGAGALVNDGTIEAITSSSSVKFTRIEAPVTAIYNSGTIGLIDNEYTYVHGGTSALFNRDGLGKITEIKEGLFQAGTGSALDLKALSSITKISGGTFESISGNAVTNTGTIGEISGGRFNGHTVALAGAGTFSNVQGGYYKAESSGNLLSSAALSGIPAGYTLSTNPLLGGSNDGFYHIGEKVSITWVVEEQNNRIDAFVKNDPVYYPVAVVIPDGKYFQGWDDGVTVFAPSHALPVASADAIYTAKFGEAFDPEDYKVVLETVTEHANRGDEFIVDVLVTSESNTSFQGATFEVLFDETDLYYEGAPAASVATGFIIKKTGTGKLEIVGASLSEGGYPIVNKEFALAQLEFKVKNNVETHDTLIKIGEGPIVDQSGAVFSEEVGKGEDLTIHLWNLKVTFVAGQHVTLSGDTIAYVRYDEAGLYADTTYTDPFDEPGRTPDSHYTLDIPVWKPAEGDNVDFPSIKELVFTGNATYTATASPSKYTIVTYPADHITFTLGAVYVEGVGYEVTYLTDVTFTMDPTDGYSVKTVTYQVGSDAPVTPTPDNGVYTIPGGEIKGDITIAFGQEVVGEIVFTTNDDYKALPSGYKLMELRVTGKLGSSEAYLYDNELMFYSTLYSGLSPDLHIYVFAVPNATTEEGARALIQIVAGETCEELAYSFDVNGDGRVNSTDVVLTYGFYKGVHSLTGEFGQATMKMRLNADITGDRKVETDDAQKILDYIWN